MEARDQAPKDAIAWFDEHLKAAPAAPKVKQVACFASPE